MLGFTVFGPTYEDGYTEVSHALSPGARQGRDVFYTVNLADRFSDLLVARIDRLRMAFKAVRSKHAFEAIAMVVMPDHFMPSGSDQMAMSTIQCGGRLSKQTFHAHC
jgi:hypothetical protein